MSDEQTTNSPEQPSIKAPPIIIVPDATYLDDESRLTSTDVILVKDAIMFTKMQEALKAWGKKPLGVPGTRNGVEG